MTFSLIKIKQAQPKKNELTLRNLEISVHPFVVLCRVDLIQPFFVKALAASAARGAQEDCRTRAQQSSSL